MALTPVPDPGSAFTRWSGDADCSDGEVGMTRAVSCTATFEPADLFSDGFESGDTTQWSAR